MRNRTKIWIALCFLALLHLGILFAGFIAPYSPTSQNRDLPFLPPTHLHFIDTQGYWHIRPFVYVSELQPGSLDQYSENQQHEYPVQFFLHGSTYKVAGLAYSNIHLLGVEAPAHIFLAGTDNYGRDEFSRMLFGGQISLAAGLGAAAISLFLAIVIGTISGFYGGLLDESAMRFAELFLVLPWLYLLLAVRAFLPLHISSLQTFFLLVGVIGTIGWARPARLIRGVVLSAKNRHYVIASRGFGASNVHILRRHVLPQTYGVLLTQAAVLVPTYVIAEVTLSFLGLGLSEPLPSWGNLLAAVQQYNVLAGYWWMFAPALALIVFCLGYSAVADAAHKTLQSTII